MGLLINKTLWVDGYCNITNSRKHAIIQIYICFMCNFSTKYGGTLCMVSNFFNFFQIYNNKTRGSKIITSVRRQKTVCQWTTQLSCRLTRFENWAAEHKIIRFLFPNRPKRPVKSFCFQIGQDNQSKHFVGQILAQFPTYINVHIHRLII